MGKRKDEPVDCVRCGRELWEDEQRLCFHCEPSVDDVDDDVDQMGLHGVVR